MPGSQELEQGRRHEAQPIPSGYKLLFPHFELVVSAPLMAAYMRQSVQLSLAGMIAAGKSGIDHAMAEYDAILKPLLNHVGSEKVVLLRNRHPETEALPPPDTGLETKTLNTKTLYSNYYWPRDFFTTINGLTIVNSDAFDPLPESENLAYSLFGDGGSVISAKNSVVVRESLWREERKGSIVRLLKNMGVTIASLPDVNNEKQENPLAINGNISHIDGHASLIVDKQGGIRLFVAKSYAYQGNHALSNIRRAADTIGARITIVDDANLPPLPLNLIQFEDGTVFVTKTNDGSLEKVLADAVGGEHVLTTDIPIVGLPKITKGSVRCMINVVPQTLLQQLTA